MKNYNLINVSYRVLYTYVDTISEVIDLLLQYKLEISG